MSTQPDDLDNASKAAGWAAHGASAAQKLMYGQPVDVVYQQVRDGWKAVTPGIKGEFAPKIGPLAGGGTRWVARTGETPVAVGRRGGLMGTNFASPTTDATSRTFVRLGLQGKMLGHASLVLGAAGSYRTQWRNDENDATLSGGERVARAGFRVAAETGLGWAGARAGAWGGAALGTAIAPGPGTVIVGIAGAIGGGVAGSKLGSKLTDGLIDDVGESVGEFFDDAKEAFTDTCEELAEAAERTWEKVRRFFQ
jgi:hypothetical protein